MFDLNLIDFENISIRLHSLSSMVKILHRYEHANHHENQCFDADPIQPVLNWFNPFHSNDECDVLCMKQVRHEMIFMVFFSFLFREVIHFWFEHLQKHFHFLQLHFTISISFPFCVSIKSGYFHSWTFTYFCWSFTGSWNIF